MFLGGAVWTIVMVKNKSCFTTTATVETGKKCTKQTKHDPSQNQNLHIQQWHAHCCPNSNNGAKEDDDKGSDGDIGCGDHFFGTLGVLDGVWGDDDVNVNDKLSLQLYDNDSNDNVVDIIAACEKRRGKNDGKRGDADDTEMTMLMTETTVTMMTTR